MFCSAVVDVGQGKKEKKTGGNISFFFRRRKIWGNLRNKIVKNKKKDGMLFVFSRMLVV